MTEPAVFCHCGVVVVFVVVVVCSPLFFLSQTLTVHCWNSYLLPYRKTNICSAATNPHLRKVFVDVLFVVMRRRISNFIKFVGAARGIFFSMIFFQFQWQRDILCTLLCGDTQVQHLHCLATHQWARRFIRLLQAQRKTNKQTTAAKQGTR